MTITNRTVANALAAREVAVNADGDDAVIEAAKAEQGRIEKDATGKIRVVLRELNARTKALISKYEGKVQDPEKRRKLKEWLSEYDTAQIIGDAL